MSKYKQYGKEQKYVEVHYFGLQLAKLLTCKFQAAFFFLMVLLSSMHILTELMLLLEKMEMGRPAGLGGRTTVLKQEGRDGGKWGDAVP